MKRPSEKLLKDMSSRELSMESEWHLKEASLLFEEVNEIRTEALELDEVGSDEMLQLAIHKETEAEAHVHQSNLLNSLMAARLPEEGAGLTERAAKV